MTWHWLYISGRLMSLPLLLLLFCGCAHKTMVAIVPDPEGKVGSATVSTAAGTVAIDAPYQATVVSQPEEAPSRPLTLGKEALGEMFADALSIEPQRPRHFLLYFREGIALLPQSEKLLLQIVAAIHRANSGYVSVIGHADTIGAAGYNWDISRRRAATVEELLVRQGVDRTTIATTWYGERLLLIPTADDVVEHANRAVEVVVR